MSKRFGAVETDSPPHNERYLIPGDRSGGQLCINTTNFSGNPQRPGKILAKNRQNLHKSPEGPVRVPEDFLNI